jgi:uncharacterized protein (TIGR02145 family)
MKTIKMILGIAVVAILSTSVYGACTSQVHMSGNKIIGLGDPIYAQDAATKKYVDAKVAVARAAIEAEKERQRLADIEAEKERQRLEDLNTPTGYKVINYGGKEWLDRNVGATASPSSLSDTNPATLGWLFQWGRPADRHQYRNSRTTTRCSTRNAPGHSNFIISNRSTGTEIGVKRSGVYNWRTTSSSCSTDARQTHLWGAPGSRYNGVCPAGWRVPTLQDFKDIGISSARDAFNKIKLTLAGYRHFNSSINDLGGFGYYWTSDVAASKSGSLQIYSGTKKYYYSFRSLGYSVRCVK